MPKITAVMIDSREPEWVQKLKFGGVPVLVDMLPTGDVQAVTDDGHTLIIERKTADDFLNTLKDDRLFPQMARMVEIRNQQLASGQPVTAWPYLIIQEPITANHDGKVVTGRGVTGWTWPAVMGTLLSIQELGVAVMFANGQLDFEDSVLRLGKRNRAPQMRIMPPRMPNVLGPKAAFLAALPGVGIERVQDVLEWAGDSVAMALIGLTDLEIKSPVGFTLRRQIRALMGLADNENIEIVLQGEPNRVPVHADLSKLLTQEECNK